MTFAPWDVTRIPPTGTETGAGLTVRRHPTRPARAISYATFNADGSIDDAEDPRYAHGFADGLDAGKSEAEAQSAAREIERVRQIEFLVSGLERAVADAAVAAHERVAEIHESIPHFLFSVLEAMLGRELALSAAPVRDAIRRAVVLDDSVGPVTVRLHPEDIETAREGNFEASGRSFTFVADPHVARGDALLSIGEASIDSQLHTALERVRTVVLDWSHESAS